jgi:sugar phosphate isomerase/epimerase
MIALRLSITTAMFNYSFMLGFEKKFRLFKETGFDYIHWCDNWNDYKLYSQDEMIRLSASIENAGLKCLDVHGTATKRIAIDSFDYEAHRKYIGLLENRIEFCHLIGGDAVVVHPPRYHTQNLERRFSRSLKVIEAVKGLCQDLGVCLAVENCHRDDHLLLERYFTLYEPELVSFCFDSGHVNINDNLDDLFQYRDIVTVTHLHDNNGKKDDHQPPGFGTVNWESVIEWLDGLEKPLNFEVTHNPLLFLGSMTEFLKRTWESIESLKVK